VRTIKIRLLGRLEAKKGLGEWRRKTGHAFRAEDELHHYLYHLHQEQGVVPCVKCKMAAASTIFG
jgi:hypothetical protein